MQQGIGEPLAGEKSRDNVNEELQRIRDHSKYLVLSKKPEIYGRPCGPHEETEKTGLIWTWRRRSLKRSPGSIKHLGDIASQ